MACAVKDMVFLEGTFSIYPKATPEYHVTVTSKELCCTPKGNSDASSTKKTSSQTVSFADIVGCDAQRGKTADCTAAYLTVYAYPQQKNNFSGKNGPRKRQTLSLVFSRCATFDENYKEALHWKHVLSYLIQKLEIKTPEDLLSLPPVPECKFLVLVNPFSGPGKAHQLFRQRVVPLFAEAGLQYQHIVTEYAGHARELVKDIKLEDWQGIVIVSGDGLVFEVVNGLMERPDWEKAIKMPIGALPGGSGNALAASLPYQLGEPYREKRIVHSAFIVAKHTPVPMDLVAVDLCSGKRLYSFLAISWGLIADVDIESERFRSIGNARFTLGTLIRIAGLRKYHGRVSFLPMDDEYRPSTTCQSSSSSKSGQSHQQSKKLSTTDGNSSSEVHHEDSSTNAASCPDAGSSPAMSGDVSTPLLPPLNSPVPSNWITVEDDFVSVAGVYQTHLAQDSIAAPHSRIADGTIFLGFTRAPISRIRLIKIFAAIQAGETVEDPSTEVIRVRAFRLEPLDGGRGTLTVDGEVVDYGPVQAQVLPSMARIMTLVKEEEEF